MRMSEFVCVRESKSDRESKRAKERESERARERKSERASCLPSAAMRRIAFRSCVASDTIDSNAAIFTTASSAALLSWQEVRQSGE